MPPSRGFSLLEIVVALFILAFGLLGLARAGVIGVTRVRDAALASVATVSAANLAEAVLAGDPQIYFADWQKQLALNLPSGTGSVRVLKSNTQIDVRWLQHFQQANRDFEIDVKN